MPVISMKQLLEAGVHFGHQSNKWNPKMKKYIFTTRDDIHIINLEDTSVCCDNAYFFIRDMVASGKNILFVGTKKQAQEAIEQEASRCGMFYIVNRWLGGTLTNFKTIRTRVARLNKLAQMEEMGEFDLLPKKEVAQLKAEKDKMFKEKDKIQAEEGNFTFKQGLRYAELNSRYGVSIGALYSTKGIKKAAKSVDEALNDED